MLSPSSVCHCWRGHAAEPGKGLGGPCGAERLLELPIEVGWSCCPPLLTWAQVLEQTGMGVALPAQPSPAPRWVSSQIQLGFTLGKTSYRVQGLREQQEVYRSSMPWSPCWGARFSCGGGERQRRRLPAGGAG